MFKDLKSNACYDNSDFYKLVRYSIKLNDTEIEEYIKMVRIENNYDVIGYYENEILVGLMIYKVDKQNLIIDVISVEKDERGKGIGGVLVKEAYRRTKCEIMEAKCNLIAASFYKKLGFEVQSIGKNYYNEENFRCYRVFKED
jgi:ribosomal protein S18 acetylase RimI-like enzyme